MLKSIAVVLVVFVKWAFVKIIFSACLLCYLLQDIYHFAVIKKLFFCGAYAFNPILSLMLTTISLLIILPCCDLLQLIY